jgi:hypothetical protein
MSLSKGQIFDVFFLENTNEEEYYVRKGGQGLLEAMLTCQYDPLVQHKFKTNPQISRFKITKHLVNSLK